jgi:hypothetical protein
MLINYLDYILLKLNRDQVDAYSRYAHGISLAAIIGLAGLPFSDENLTFLILKCGFLLFTIIIFFLVGSLLLGEINDHR